MVNNQYDIDEAAQLSGLAAQTLRKYTTGGCSTLVRGRDFVVVRRSRFGRIDRKLLFSRRGMERIISRDFVSMSHQPARRVPDRDRSIIDRWIDECLSVNLGSPRTVEGGRRRFQYRIAQLARALMQHPCDVPACICKCHRLVYNAYRVEPRPEMDSSTSPGTA